MQTTEQFRTSRRIIRVRDLPTIPGYGWLTEAALRHLIFKSRARINSRGESTATNGLMECGAIIRIGRRILVDLDKFDCWVDRHSGELGGDSNVSGA